MKKLFSIASTDCIQSILPILMWYVLGIAYKDTDYFNVFTLTYPFQFIMQLVLGLIIVGTIKYEKKNKAENNDYAYSSLIISLIIFSIFVGIVTLNIDEILKYLNTALKYKNVYIFGLLCMMFDIFVIGVSRIEQYKEQDKSAFIISVKYYTYKILSIIIVRALVKENNLALVITLIFIAVYILILGVTKIKIHKFRLNVFKGLKYQISGSVSDIAMFIIYFVGLQKVVSGSPSFLTAYNIAAMCTDTQWDILYSAIDTNTSIEVCNNTYDKNIKKLLKSSVLYSIILFLSSLAMIVINHIINPFDVRAAINILLIECIWFPCYAMKYVFESWLKLEYNGVWLVIIPLVIYIIRTFASFVILSKYALSLGVLIAAILGYTSITILYTIKRKGRINKNGV